MNAARFPARARALPKRIRPIGVRRSWLPLVGWVSALSATTHCGGEFIALGDGPVDISTALGTSDGDAGMGVGGQQGTARGGGGGGDAAGAIGGGNSVGGSAGSIGDSNGDTGIAGADSAFDAGSANGTCMLEGVPAAEVLWIGDSWFTMPDELQRKLVVASARSAGVIGETADYPSRAAAATPLSAIVEQYRSQRAIGPAPRVLIMDGGTWDTIQASGSDESVAAVQLEFEAFLGELASDGSVENLIYMLMPELPTIPGVAALRPGLMAACERSPVPCHFLDLEPLWEGHPEYTASGIQASEAGAAVIAEQTWNILQGGCDQE